MNPLTDIAWQSVAGVSEHAFLGEIYRIQGYDVERTSWAQLGIYVLTVFMVLLAAWQGTLAAMRWFKKPSKSANKLLVTLMRSHHLTRSEMKLVEQLANKLPPSIPATALFIDPQLWDNEHTSEQSALLMQLRKKLFEA